MENQTGRVTEGGSAKEATVKQLPISTAIAGVSMRLKPGAIRELHWHANAAEWAFVIKGKVRATVFGPDNLAETNDFDPGDVWYFPRGHGHAVQNMSHEEAHFILVFDNGTFSENGTFSITDWLGHTPPSVLAQGLGLSEAEFAKFPREELYIVNGRVPPEQPEANHQKLIRSSPQTHRYQSHGTTALLAFSRRRGTPGERSRIPDFQNHDRRRAGSRRSPRFEKCTGIRTRMSGSI